jgi:hypothetical protein
METNDILYDIDTTNTFKYQGSTVENPALTILDTHFGDQGNYYCYGENDVDCGNSSVTVLTVFGGKCVCAHINIHYSNISTTSSVFGNLLMRTPTIAVFQLYRDIRRQVKVRFRLYTRWVAHVEQVLRILPENYMSSPIFIGVSVARSLVFGVEYCILLIVLFLFLLVIVLSVIL